MRRFSALILGLVLLLAGCGARDSGVTYPEPEPGKPWVISKAQADPQDPAFLHLPDHPNTAFFSLHMEPPAGQQKLILFRLHSGTWEDVAGGSWEDLSPDSWDAEGASSGTMALSFDRIYKSCTQSYHIGQGTGSTVLHGVQDCEKLDRLNAQTTFLTARTEADWEQLIPLAVQVLGPQDRLMAPSLDIWEHPEAYENQSYQEVFLLALSLSSPSSAQP